ncbi:DUF2933 domain-containing protein [Paraburkholderia tagetis]|uniref:DUF2933 domain-containing protein n=1 Tax=Paraburkholderia tagetis TaxID=2913261 RepID=A0A9X2A0N3_9BURK|nr:DUF2933 domain-containing protein [Paraburkholderia tagetis]MCG5078529.1 DUF2933 domain-containing protein [Paraburkholderia tagetis]
MKCNTKTMVATALTLALILNIGYWALPQFRGALTSFIGIAIALVCPLSMLFMMRGMQSHTDSRDKVGPVSDKTTS